MTAKAGAELLDVVWAALNSATESQALVMARRGEIIVANRVAAELYRRSSHALKGMRIDELLADTSPKSRSARWQTALTGISARPIPVEVRRQFLRAPFQDVELFAIHDLRAHRAAADGLEHGAKLPIRPERNEPPTGREQELAEQNARFDIAINNMSQGLCLFDAGKRVVFANKRYAEIYGLTPAQVKPGTALREILEARAATGLYDNVDGRKFVRDGVATFRQKVVQVLRLADGRSISVVRLPMPDGSLISTHEDITERERLNLRLAEQHMQLDAALDNMLQGLAMFDADRKVIVCNRRYAEMYGLAPDQVKPGTSAREMLQYRIDNGLCRIQETEAPTSVRRGPEKSVVQVFDEILGRMAENDSSSYVAELEDGRYIAVSAKRMPGGGVVTTHQDITQQYRSEAKIAHMALHDALTGLPNRVLLNERLEHALGRSKRGEMIAVHVLDLDRFKHVNDTMGHPAGDKLLKMVTDRLCSLVQVTDTVARLGGDEFAVLQAGISHSDDATALAYRIIEAISSPYEIDGQQVAIGTSVGIAIGPADGDSPEEILRNADLALYRAKGDGRGTHRFFEQEMDRQIQTRRALECDLRRALVAGELELHYQPVVDVATSSITGLEALIRWRHPEHGLMAPAAFIPLAEETGLIGQIGEWTVREACATAAHWRNDWKVAVNLSAAQFKNPRLMHVVATALASSGLRPDLLELEITETTLLHDSQATLSTFHELRALGVRIVMDDFGAGHSSLGYLQRFPFDKIKIDRSFVQSITESAGSLNIVRAVAALAHGLGIASTAEGVETPAQLEAVKAEGCSEMQGFLFSRPLPAHEIDRLLAARKLPTGAAAA